MHWQRFTQQFDRWRYRRRAADELLQCWNQLPGSIEQCRYFLAVDLEMTSLSVEDGELVSLAWVGIDDGWISMSSAKHILVTGQQSVGRSAEVHQLRDCERRDGESVEFALRSFLDAACGRVLIFHHARLDCAYLNTLSRQLFQSPLCLPFLDTMEVERRRLLRRQDALGTGDLRLAHSRRRYGLPDYPAHNALNDALATAELFLAQGQT